MNTLKQLNPLNTLELEVLRQARNKFGLSYAPADLQDWSVNNIIKQVDSLDTGICSASLVIKHLTNIV